MNTNKTKYIKFACYLTNVAMAGVGILSPLLFETFKSTYGISYTLLGLLVVVNFFTQLIIDLIFTFFSSKFNTRKTVLIMPLLTITGLLIYAILPRAFPSSAYVWLVLGTVVFSAAAGLNEVLISPIIAALPSDNPERDMSNLHSSYAWGLVGVVIFGTVFLKIFTTSSWSFLAIIFAFIPLIAFTMFMFSDIPDITSGNKDNKSVGAKFGIGILMCFFCIFLGGAAEGAMTQWASSYIESALRLPKLLGDILGMAMFAVMLGLGRTLYAKFGKRILNVIILGMIGSVICYLSAALVPNSYVGLIACALTGFSVSMLWPGTIILIGEKFPTAGVAAYALMAAGGDLGISVAPQFVGMVADTVSTSDLGARIAESLNISSVQVGMRSGILLTAIFPLVGAILAVVMKIYFKKKDKKAK